MITCKVLTLAFTNQSAAKTKNFTRNYSETFKPCLCDYTDSKFRNLVSFVLVSLHAVMSVQSLTSFAGAVQILSLLNGVDEASLSSNHDYKMPV